MSERGDLIWGTTPRLVQEAATRMGDRLAIVDEGGDGARSLSYAELAVETEAAARAFMAAGIEPGDRVSIWAPNTWEWVVALLGLHAAGGVLVPLNTRYKGREAAYVLEKSAAKVLVTVNGFLGNDYVDELRSSGVALPALERVVVLRGDPPSGTEPWAAFVQAGSAVPAAGARARARAVSPLDLSDILFTSGTTGRPKGVMTAHGQNLRAFLSWADLVGLQEGDRYLVVNPFFHSFGYKAGILAALMKGATLFPQAVFDVVEVMHRVARERITMLPGPPTLYQSILNHGDFGSVDLSSLRLAVTGAASIPVELILRMRRELTFDSIITAYGLTETCGVVTACRQGDDPETIATTSGRAIPDIEVRCVDDDGAEVPPGSPGEVVARGYNVMQGYFDDAEATALTIDADGWLHTGDIGVMDERGYLRITDRKKDMFIVGGFNVYPAEIENTILGHDAVAQVAVVGIADERMGEVGVAFVVPRPDAVVDVEAFTAWCRERMANFKVPRRVEVVDSLPLNATGKVLKYELRAGLSGD
jgi:HIP---CoA ligase